MISLDNAYAYIKENLTEKRYIHTLGVISVGKKLAAINGVNEEKVEMAALCHDIAKYIPKDEALRLMDENEIVLSEDEKNTPELWHSILGPIVAKREIEIEDEDILGAIRWHTTGRENMTTLEKIIYIADMIEPSRVYEGVDDIRTAVMNDLDEGVIKGMEHTIMHLISKGVPIDIRTVKARNYLVTCIKDKKNA